VVSAIGEERKKRSKKLDFLLLLGASLFVALAGTSVFWVADEHHVNPGWLFAIGSAILFSVVVGRGYRRKFRDPTFVSFFLAWLFLHVVIYLLVLGYLGFLYYIPIAVLELWIGYTIAIWQFGPPRGESSPQ